MCFPHCLRCTTTHLANLNLPVHPTVAYLDLCNQGYRDCNVKTRFIGNLRMYDNRRVSHLDLCGEKTVKFHFCDDFYTLIMLDFIQLYESVIPITKESFLDAADISKYLQFRCRMEDYGIPIPRRAIYEKVLNVLFKRACRDSKVVMELLNLVCSSDTMKKFVMCGPRSIQKFEYLLSHREVRKTLQLWSKRITDGQTSQFDDPVMLNVFKGNYRHASVLLKHGFDLKLEYGRERFYEMLVFSELSPTVDLGGPCWLNFAVTRHHESAWRLIHYRRIILVLMTLHGLQDFNHEAYSRSLRILWRSIPDYYTTFSEVFAIQSKIYRQSLDHIVKFRLECSKMRNYEWIVETHTPRPLRHHCRYVIRESLKKNFNLPEGIDDLPLPKTMISYLKLMY